MYSFVSRPVLRSLSFATGRGFTKQVVQSRSKGSRLTEKLIKVDAYVRDSGRVPIRDFLDGLKELTQPGTNVTPIQGLLMLRCCGSLLQEETPERRNELAEKIWTALINREVRLDISHYNALLRIYLENGRQFDPFQFLEDLESKKIQPNRVTYQRIIHHFCSTGGMAAAAKLLLMIKERNVLLNETIFNSLLMGHIKAGDFDDYRATLQMMTASELDPSPDTYASILSAAAEMSSSNPRFIELFNETLKECREKGIELSDQQKLEISVRIPENQSNLFDQMISVCNRGGDYNTDCYNAILELVNMKKLDYAIKLLKTMNRPSSSSDSYKSGSFMIRQMVKSNIEPSKVKEICDLFKRKGLNYCGLSVAVESAFENLDLEPSRIYLEYFIEESEDKVGRPHYYWPLLTKCKSDAQVFDVLMNDMASMDKLSSARSILDTFEEYVWTKNIRDSSLLLEQLKTVGYSISLVLTSLVNHHVQNHRLNEALQVLSKNSHIFVHPRFIAPNLALSFVQKGTVQDFVSILKKLRSMSVDGSDEEWIGRCLLLFVRAGGHSRVPINEILAGMKGVPIPCVVIDALKEQNMLNDQDIEMLRDSSTYSYTKSTGADGGDVDVLENHLTELKSRGLNTRGCLRRLILAYCKKPVRIGDDSGSIIKRVEELLADLRDQNFFLSHAMHASLMDLYANHGEVEIALKMKVKIPESDFNIDPFKILDLATALIKAGRRDEALLLIQEQSGIERPPKEEVTPDSVERVVHKVLNAAAEVTRDAKYVENLLELVLPLVNVRKPSNVMMGPVVKVHLLNDNVKGALDQFAYAASNYKIAPWKGELMKRIIEMDDPVNLQLITDISVKIHGEQGTLVDVAVAFVKAGKLIQAKKVTNHPSFSRADRAIRRAAERMVTMNEVEHLEKFVELVSQVSGVEKEPIYYQLIRGYSSRNEPNKALDVWTTMQEQEVIPSPQTLRYLGSFLEESGLAVPFDYSQPKQQKQSSQEAGSKTDGASKYSSSVRTGDLDEVLDQRKKLLSSGQSLLVTAESSLIERLIANDRHTEAVDIMKNLIQKGLFPIPRAIRQVIGVLNKNGDVETMKSLEGKLPEQLKNQSWYTNQLAYCYLTAGKEETLLSEVLPALKPVPLSALLTLLQRRPEFEPNVLELADKTYKEENYSLMYNMVWIHRMISGRYNEAQSLLDEVPPLKDSLLFQTLVNRIKLEKDLELADALISMLEKTNLMGRTLAVVHSAKVDALIELDRPEEAEQYLMRVVKEAKPRIKEPTGEVISPLNLSEFRRMTLVRLHHKLIEVCGREPMFTLPTKLKEDKIEVTETQHQDDIRL